MKHSDVKNFYFIPKVKVLRPLPGCVEAEAIGRISVSPITTGAAMAARYLQELFFQAAGINLPIEWGGDVGAGAAVGIDMRVEAEEERPVTAPTDGANVNTNINTNGANTVAGTDATAYSSERYRLTVSPDGVKIRAASAAGLFRAAATFIQLTVNGVDTGNHRRIAIPCADICDWPDFQARGFYHDVTRGRVPTLNSLKRLADTLAFYKINQLQLYVEHTFAFSMIPEFSDGKTPLTAADILELDGHCAKRGIDLVPSLSTFGHLYELLRLPRFERLNELDIRASETPRDLWDRMAHYTLDVGNPDSVELVKGMIEEYAPLFSSPLFNICCDETFDLGKGKNAERARREGVGRLYAEFVNKIIGAVKSVGKRPMLWGDIVIKHPEYISEFPADTIFLNWDYAPDASGESVKKFQAAGVTQYACPGVQGWSRFAADVDRACANISRMARFGLEAGAAGFLNTDWGDCGHVNLPAASCHGLTFGAALSWNAGDGEDAGDFDERFSFLQWGIRGGDGRRLGSLLRELGRLSGYHFGNLYAWVINKQCLWYKEDDVKTADWRELSAKAARAGEIKMELEAMAGKARGLFGGGYRDKYNNDQNCQVGSDAAIVNDNPQPVCQDTDGSRATDNCRLTEFDEYIWGAGATEWLLSLLIAKKKYEYGENVDAAHIEPAGLIAEGRALLERFKALWRICGRESELRDVVETFETAFAKIAEFK